MIALPLALSLALAARPQPAPPQPTWLGDELPLPLSVKTPEELRLKGIAERQYLIFNLIAGGKQAWDAGDYLTAANKWEALLRLDNLPPDIASAVQPFAAEARKRAGGATAAPVAVAPSPTPAPAPPPAPAAASEAAWTTVRGSVSGGGSSGPGGAVVWLERANGATPRPRPAKNKVIIQKGKAFVPRVLAVPVGTTVEFRNDDDELFHNVFSLSSPNGFDLGLYKGGATRTQTFDAPGAVQLLCNIHSTMQGWVFVVKSPWFGQADSNGAFAIHGVPPGDYVLHAWHEGAAKQTEQPLHVGPEGAQLALTVGSDAPIVKFVPDKYGKPRQVHLGY